MDKSMDWSKEIQRMINKRPGALKTNSGTLEAPYGEDSESGLGGRDEWMGYGDQCGDGEE